MLHGTPEITDLLETAINSLAVAETHRNEEGIHAALTSIAASQLVLARIANMPERY